MTSRLDRSHEVGIKFSDDDALSHHLMADRILGDIPNLPPGSVISVQGPWGRGKTDIVARVFDAARRDPAWPKPIWVNPWQYGTPDLIRPVVMEMLKRIPPQTRSANDKLRRAARTLLRAGNAMLFKAISVVAPFGDIIGAGEKQIDEFLAGMFDDEDKSPLDPDPVYAMAERFRELTEEYLAITEQGDGRLLVCVDDLDRCLPDHQIAMLEAIHFLTGAEASCSFLIALDPLLVQQAARTHYKSAEFDSEQYLNKLFNLRLNLPPVSNAAIQELVKINFRRIAARTSRESAIERAFGMAESDMGALFLSWVGLPELRNPRLIRRILDRFSLLARRLAESQDERLQTPLGTEAAVVLCAISERWPEVRGIFQALSPKADVWRLNAQLLCYSYGLFNELFTTSQARLDVEMQGEGANMLARMPPRDRTPDLGRFLLDLYFNTERPVDSHSMSEALCQAESVMTEYGL